MLIHFSVPVLIAVNIIAWLLFHLGFAALATALPLRLFPSDGRLCRERRWEMDGRIYEKLFGIKRWKHLLPEGADLLGAGFRKGRLERRNASYLHSFYRETCRAEFTHWWVWLSGLLFFIWNPVWAGWVMAGYASLANAPCILAQRYNRLRLRRVFRRWKNLDSER